MSDFSDHSSLALKKDRSHSAHDLQCNPIVCSGQAIHCVDEKSEFASLEGGILFSKNISKEKERQVSKGNY